MDTVKFSESCSHPIATHSQCQKHHQAAQIFTTRKHTHFNHSLSSLSRCETVIRVLLFASSTTFRSFEFQDELFGIVFVENLSTD